jgi:RimJ/RimL family protein N-acetyltransferase
MLRIIGDLRCRQEPWHVRMSRSITTARLRIRPFIADDLGALLAYRRDPEVARYQSWSETFTEAEGRAFIDAVTRTPFGTPGAWINLGIELTATRELLGDVAFRVASDGSAGEIGFTLAREQHGRGYASEAVGAFCDFALRTLPLRALFAITDARNTPSIRLLGRLGFHEAGFHARAVMFKGEPCDELRFERARCA